MKNHPRDTCKRCGNGLEGYEQGHRICMACGKRELSAIGRYFRNGAIIGFILAVLLYVLLGTMQRNYQMFSEQDAFDGILYIRNMSANQRLGWAALMLIIPFGYYHVAEIKNRDIVYETTRAEAFSSDKRGIMISGATVDEGFGMFLFILSILTAPMVGPVLILYRLGRVIRLRRYVIGGWYV